MSEIIIRPAQKKEAADLAILDNLAGHGISHWFWEKAVAHGQANDPLDFGRARFASDEVFAWRNAYVAVEDDMIAGSITSYVMPESDNEEMEVMKQEAAAFVPVFELYAAATNHWFIDSFAVFSSHRGQGLGEALLKNSLLRGRHSGVERAMLVCEDTNSAARALYEKYDFNEIDDRPFVDFGLNHTVNKWLLLAADY